MLLGPLLLVCGMYSTGGSIAAHVVRTILKMAQPKYIDVSMSLNQLCKTGTSEKELVLQTHFLFP